MRSPGRALSVRADAPSAPPARDARVFVSCAFVALLLAVVGFSYPELGPSDDGSERMIGGLLLAATSLIVIWRSVGRDGAPDLSLLAPASLYPLFYGLYFLIPYGILLIDPAAATTQFPQLGLAILLGLIAFLFGCRCAIRFHGKEPRVPGNDTSALSLVITCWIGVVLVAAFWRFRILIGQFYSHAQIYWTGTDATSSFYENFVGELQLPLVLLLGLASQIPSRWRAAARITFYAYSSALFITYVMASMFRASLTVLVFAALSATLHSRLRPKHVVTIGLFGAGALFVIFLLRATDLGNELAGSPNQWKDVVSALSSDRLRGSAPLSRVLGRSDEAGGVSQRATLPLMFIQDIMYQTADDYPFGIGRTFRHETAQFIPRVFWGDKPIFMSTQRLIRARLDMSDVDDSPNAIAQGYYEFGWWGVIGLHFVMGMVISTAALNLQSLPSYFVLFFMWTAYSLVDAGIYLNTLVKLRTCLLFLAMFCVVRITTQLVYRPHHRSRAI